MSDAGQRVEVQLAVDDDEPPDPRTLRRWAGSALAAAGSAGAALTIRVVDADEARCLNRDFRGRDYATNVLSFPFSELPPEAMAEMGGPYIGDIAICADVVAREADEQDKPVELHWAHMVVHGVLHLTGFDHDHDVTAQIMEGREREILAGLGFPDPYADTSAVRAAPGEDRR